MGFEVSPRKQMAMGKSMPKGDSFGTKSYESMHGGMASSDRGMKHEPMDDGNRGVGHPVGGGKGIHPQQAAPDHGHGKIKTPK